MEIEATRDLCVQLFSGFLLYIIFLSLEASECEFQGAL